MRLSIETLGILIALIVLASNASAAIEGFPSTIDFYNEPVKIVFSVSNPSDSAKRFSIEFSSPLDLNIDRPLTIDAKQSATVVISLVPKKEFIGQEYASTLIVKVGEEETRQKVKLVFHPAIEKSAIPIIDANAFGLSGMVSFFSNPASELAIDIALVIIAIILLIAFIARLVKRFAVKK